MNFLLVVCLSQQSAFCRYLVFSSLEVMCVFCLCLHAKRVKELFNQHFIIYLTILICLASVACYVVLIFECFCTVLWH